MAPSHPSSKPYTAVSAADGIEDYRDGHFTITDHDGDGCGGDDVAAQSVDLQLEQDRNEADKRERSFKCTFLASACLLAALVFGGREYYVRNYGDGNSSSLNLDADWEGDGWDGLSLSNNGVRGSSSNDLKGSDFDDDSEIGQVPFEGLDLVEGQDYDDYLGGEELYEGDLDDEIANGEVAGEFDEDMDYDDGEGFSGDSIDYETENVMEVFDEERSSSSDADDELSDIVIESEEEGSSGEEIDEVPEDEEGEGEDSVSSGLTIESEEVAEVEPEHSDHSGDSPDEDLTKEEGEDESPKEAAPPAAVSEEDLPDYFVPLTPAEREQLKERLRNTLRETKNALLASAKSPSVAGKRKDDLVNPSPQRTLVLSSESPKQFMHMHHMKTGGTSMDGLISCALRRQRELHNGTSINYARMSECGSRVRTCMDDLAKKLDASVVDNVFYRNGEDGKAQVDAEHSFDPAEGVDIDDLNVCTTSEANVMSYCASLHAVRTFGWKGVDKITVIRNPVDRAWSMYRFSLNRCYNCQEMKDVLRHVAGGTFVKGGKVADEPNFAYEPNDSCAVQMIGHQATNLLSSIDLYNVANDVRFPREKEIVDEAVRNLREEFTWIGITDRIEESVDGIRTVFPFLAENLNEAVGTLQEVLEKSGEPVNNARFSLPSSYKDEKGCQFQHRNAGRDPTCGTKELDDETIALIKKLSNRDVAVYKAAVERFEVQMEVLGEYRDGTL